MSVTKPTVGQSRGTWGAVLNAALDDLDTRKLDATTASGVYAAVFAADAALGDGVVDATAGLQARLDAANAAGGGTVFVPDGTYLITTALTIGSHTRLELSPRATIRRNAAIDNMIRNKADGTTGGYLAASDIEIVGGTWDANKATYASNVTGLAFGHANNIRLRNLTVKNIYGWHHVELNGVQHAVVRDCTFLDLDDITTGKEMIQLDLLAGGGNFPWFGPYDSTATDDVLIEGNTFRNGARGVGSHSTGASARYTNTRIVGNHFDDMSEQPIFLYDFERCSIVGNTIDNCLQGIYANASKACSGLVISGNTLDNIAAGDTTSARGIHLNGGSAANVYVRDCVITGNSIHDVGRHGLSIDFCQGVTVASNRVTGCGAGGIWVYRSKKVNVTGNNAEGNNVSAGAFYDLTAGSNNSGTETQDVTIVGNVCGTARMETGDRYIFTGNIATGAYSLSAVPPTNVQKFSNFIAGAWVA